MQIGILHLSDIHLVEPANNNSVMDKIAKIAPAIRSELIGTQHLFIAVSGDVAFSGKEEEYFVALEAFDQLSDLCASQLEVKPQFVLIPGNHDCDFSADTHIRRIVVGNVKDAKAEIDLQVIDQCCVTQQAYRAFARVYEEKDSFLYHDPLFGCSTFHRDGTRIVFYQFNSSWISEKNEKPGQLVFPIQDYENLLEESAGDLVITMLHHPYNWFHPENGRKLRQSLERYSDVVLTGHEHVPTVTKSEDFHGQRVEHIEGGVLQDSHVAENSGFNLLKFNLEDRMQEVVQFEWAEQMYRVKSTSGWVEFKRSEWLGTKTFRVSDEFMAFLQDPGLTLSHPRKTQLTLDDTFLYPDVRLIDWTKRTDILERYIGLDTVISNIGGDGKVLIVGEEKSGKTTICKVVYKSFYEQGLVPVLIEGASIVSPRLEDFERLITRNFAEQYGDTRIEQFKQLDYEQRVVIIDNLDGSRLNSTFKYELLNRLDRVYHKVIVTGTSELQFAELMTSNDKGDTTATYQKLEIVEFGHKLRYDLVDKWNRLGREYTVDEDEVLAENDRMIRVLETVLGYNFVPSFPFFLLVLLQTMEAGTHHNLKESSYGYYYDFLITREFMKMNLRHEDIDALYSYFTELAYKFYSQGEREVTGDQFQSFNRWFIVEYELADDFEAVIQKLVSASILEQSRDVYRFRYPYIYYYFVARYLANNIGNSVIRENVSTMCSKIHVSEYANVIMFLTHLSKDPFVLDEIVSNANKIFEDVSPTTLGNDVAPINSLIGEVPKMVYENIDIHEHRRQRLIAKDELERTVQESAPNLERDAEVQFEEEIDVVAKLNSAFKTLEILGQILKNYYGSIKRDEKYEICKRAYDLGLRALNSFLTLLATNLDLIVDEVSTIVESKGISNDRARVDRISKRFVFNLTFMVCFQFIRKISMSVGSRNLMETFKRISSEDKSIAVRLIDISLRLDNLQFIPFAELEEFKRVAKGNALGYTLSKALVMNHMYMYNVPYKDKQRIAEMLGISIERQRSIDLLSNRKRKK